MRLSLPFEWLTIENIQTKELTQNAGMYIETIIDHVPCYWQLDMGCSTTMIDKDFLEKYGVLNKNISATDVYIYGPNKKHFKNVSIYLPNLTKSFSIPHCFIENNITQQENLYEKEILKKDLPFAGYLGMDFFEGKSLSIDFKQQVIHIFEDSPKLKNSSKFFRSSGLIIIPVFFDETKLYALFDTATRNTAITIENSIFGDITNKKITDLAYKKIIRPDFSFNTFYLEHFVSLKIGKMQIRQKILIETPDKERNVYFYIRNKSGINAILGNALFRNHIVTFNFQNNTFTITN